MNALPLFAKTLSLCEPLGVEKPSPVAKKYNCKNFFLFLCFVSFSFFLKKEKEMKFIKIN